MKKKVGKRKAGGAKDKIEGNGSSSPTTTKAKQATILPYAFEKDQTDVTFEDAVHKLEVLIDNPESFIAPPPELAQVRLQEGAD